MTHTHRGHCQACGRLQAVTNEHHGFPPRLAKHGYKVAGFGYFFGTCRGSGHQPIERDHSLLEQIAVSLTEYADSHDRLAADFEAGRRTPDTVPTGRFVYVDRKATPERCPWAEADQYAQVQEVKRMVWQYQSQAKQARQHRQMLLELKDQLSGKPLTANPDLTKPAPLTVERGMSWVAGNRTFRVVRCEGRHVIVVADEQPGRNWRMSLQMVRNRLKQAAQG